MKYLVDTGILLRLVHPTDPLHKNVSDSMELLKNQGHQFCCAVQNVVEFWNATTRPLSARGGFGLAVAEAARRLSIIERAVEVLPEPVELYAQWKHLVTSLSVSGVQVHDTRLAALMRLEAIPYILTLNPIDFRRFTFVNAITPMDVLGMSRQHP